LHGILNNNKEDFMRKYAIYFGAGITALLFLGLVWLISGGGSLTPALAQITGTVQNPNCAGTGAAGTVGFGVSGIVICVADLDGNGGQEVILARINYVAVGQPGIWTIINKAGLIRAAGAF